MRGVWHWLLLTACYSGGAVELHVMPAGDVEVASVELFVAAVDDEKRVEPLRPEAAPALINSAWWTRDPRSELDMQTMTRDGVVYPFGLGGIDDDLEAVIAVGYDASGNPVAMASHLKQINIPQDSAIDRYIMQLAAVEALPRSVPSTVPGLKLWGASDNRACVQVDNVPDLKNFEGVLSAMIVKQANDPDCDDLADDDATECLPRTYMGQTRMTRDSLSCGISTHFFGQTACIVGGATCRDGTGMVAGDCSPSSYCTPWQICEACSTGTCDFSVRDATTVPYIQCNVAVGDAATPGAGPTFCDNTNITLDFRLLGGQFAQLSCNADPGAKIRKPGGLMFGTTLEYPSGGKINMLADTASPCVWKFSASGAVPLVTINSATEPQKAFPGVFTVPLANGRGLLLPIVFRDAGATCLEDAISCTYYAAGQTYYDDPGLDACLAAPVVPGTEVKD